MPGFVSSCHAAIGGFRFLQGTFRAGRGPATLAQNGEASGSWRQRPNARRSSYNLPSDIQSLLVWFIAEGMSVASQGVQVMSTVTFYRQKRVDGGIRSGIDIDGISVLESFAKGKADYDPALAWYVDVRCQGKNLPDSPEPARRWLLEREETVREALDQLAEDLRAGLDIESWPLHRQIPAAPSGARMTIVCSAVRRINALKISDVLRQVGLNWRKFLTSLQAVHPISS
jgi:hypothetical protein